MGNVDFQKHISTPISQIKTVILFPPPLKRCKETRAYMNCSEDHCLRSQLFRFTIVPQVCPGTPFDHSNTSIQSRSNLEFETSPTQYRLRLSYQDRIWGFQRYPINFRLYIHSERPITCEYRIKFQFHS